MKFFSFAMVVLAGAAGTARAEPQVVTYYNGGNGTVLANAAAYDYTVINVSFLMPDASNNNQLGWDAIGTTFLGPNITTGVANGIRALQASGKKVTLAFGGAAVTSAQYAALSQNITGLAQNISSFVLNSHVQDGSTIHFDGVDIDWEDTLAFSNPGAAGYNGVAFLQNLTTALRTDLPQGQYLLTHAPQPPYLSDRFDQSGFGIGGYIPVLNAVAGQIDWINMQYYNNPPFEGVTDLLQNYNSIVNGWTGVPNMPDFNGLDADKLLVGKPVAPGYASSGYLPPGQIVSDIIVPLKAAYGNDFGGVFSWQLAGDTNGAWASTMKGAVGVPEPGEAAAMLAAGAGIFTLAVRRCRYSRRLAGR